MQIKHNISIEIPKTDVETIIIKHLHAKYNFSVNPNNIKFNLKNGEFLGCSIYYEEHDDNNY